MDFITFLDRRLREPLPASLAHREFVPDLADANRRLRPAPDTARQSAVVVPLVATADDLPDVLLELRSETLRNHRGQISFPGGRVDDGEDAADAALRELYEEVGVAAGDVVLLGELTPLYIPPSNSAVRPFVGYLRTADELVLSDAEVAETIRIPLLSLVAETSVLRAPWELNGSTVTVPHWQVHPRVPLWGATAMILNELIWLTREYLRRP